MTPARTAMAFLFLIAIWLLPASCAQTAEQPEASHTKQRAELTRFNKERLRFKDKAWFQYLAKHRKTTPAPGVGQSPGSWVGENARPDWEAHFLREQFLSENLAQVFVERKVHTETRLTEFPPHIRDAVHEWLSLGDTPRRRTGIPKDLLSPLLVTIQVDKNAETRMIDNSSGVTTVTSWNVVLVRAGVTTRQLRSLPSKRLVSGKETAPPSK